MQLTEEDDEERSNQPQEAPFESGHDEVRPAATQTFFATSPIGTLTGVKRIYQHLVAHQLGSSVG